MAHRKAGGSAKNLRDSNPKYLGIKISDGASARPGQVVVRQRGTRIMPGTGIGLGRDHTLFALKPGIVKYGEKRHRHFDGRNITKKVVSIISKSVSVIE
jgi:large subunit ribosomal protein L27